MLLLLPEVTINCLQGGKLPQVIANRKVWLSLPLAFPLSLCCAVGERRKKKRKKKSVGEGVRVGEAEAGNNEDRRPGLAGFLCEVQHADIPGGAVLTESRLKRLTPVETRTLHPTLPPPPPKHTQASSPAGSPWQMEKGEGEVEVAEVEGAGCVHVCARVFMCVLCNINVLCDVTVFARRLLRVCVCVFVSECERNRG